MPLAVTPQEPHVIQPTAVYSLEEAIRLLMLQSSTIRTEVRRGSLRVAKRLGRSMLLGSWLLAWSEAGEYRSRKANAVAKQLAAGKRQ